MPAHHHPHRRFIRLPDWDYRTHALYFVTICTIHREHLFTAEPLAAIAVNMWTLIPQMPHAQGVALDEWVLMPNHLHGLLLLPSLTPDDERDPADPVVIPGLPFDMRYAAQPEPPPRDEWPHGIPKSLGTIIGTYKSGVTRRINALRKTSGHRVWQRGYYEHIVRNDRELERIRVYIRENPARWAEDRDDLDRLVARMMHRNGGHL